MQGSPDSPVSRGTGSNRRTLDVSDLASTENSRVVRRRLNDERVTEANAMVLATDSDAVPSTRTVLLRSMSAGSCSSL